MIAVRFLLAAVIATGLVGGFNYLVDPLQIFRPARFYTPGYPTEERLHNAGLIRSQSFDTIFMGDSIGLHLRSSEIDQRFGTRVVKLAMSGSTSREQNFVLKAALERGPKQVLWEMDDLLFADVGEVDSLPYFPADLYRMNLKGTATYLFNLETGREAFFLLLRSWNWKPISNLRNGLIRAGYLKYDKDNVDELNTFDEALAPSAYNANKCLAAYKYYSLPENRSRLGAGYDQDVMVRIFERDVISLIRERSDVRFTIYFPPYSMVQYATMRDLAAPAMLRTFFGFNSYVLQRLAQFANVTLFDFRDDAQMSHDLSQYGDAIHHSPATGRLLLSRIAEGRSRVDGSDPYRSIEQLKTQINAYRLPR